MTRRTYRIIGPGVTAEMEVTCDEIQVADNAICFSSIPDTGGDSYLTLLVTLDDVSRVELIEETDATGT